MKLDERHLVQLAAVIQAGGVTEGAALLGLSQPAVSRTLSMLEKRIGEPLFVKGRRPLQPTPLGRALAEHGQTMLTASRKASEMVESFRQGGSGVVRVAGTPFFMDGLISGLIGDFQNAHPDVRIDQTYGYFPALRAALSADRIDLAICPVDLLDEGSGLAFGPLLPGRNVVACGATHPLLMKRRPDPRALLDYPWIAPPPDSPLLADLISLILSLGATEPKIRYTGGSLIGVLNVMKATNALTILPESVVFALRAERSVTALPFTVPHPERALGLLRGAGAAASPAIERFARHIQAGTAALRAEMERHAQVAARGKA